MRVFLALGNEKLAAELKYKLQKCGKNTIEIVEQKYHLYSPGSQSNDVVILDVSEESIHMAVDMHKALPKLRQIWIVGQGQKVPQGATGGVDIIQMPLRTSQLRALIARGAEPAGKEERRTTLKNQTK